MQDVKTDGLAADLRASLDYERGWCLRRTGKGDESAEVFRALLKTEPPLRLKAHALLELADLETTAKRQAEAIAALESLRALLDDAKDALPPALDEQASYRLGVALFQSERMADAEKMLERLLRDHPKSDLVRSAAMFRGEALVSLSRHQDAVSCFERVIAGPADDPSHGPALLRLGDAFATLQEWSRSAEMFGKYLKEHADGAQWYQAEFGLGWAIENQGQHETALEHYRRVVAKHQGPTAARAQFQIGQCLFAKKEYETAAAELLKVDILYAYPEWSAAALFEAGRCFEALARRAEARQQFEAVVARFAETRWAAMSSERLRQAADTGLPGR
jgi:TolA-binding protein